tara:strand:- start:326 stop:1132 length:807 start_codon:yes stop_codon:yes gene_type:complete
MNSTITFYDGTTLKGDLSSSDKRHVFIIPEGLAVQEKIPVVDIDNLFLENGIILVENGLAKQTYIDGKFSVIQRNDNENFSLEDNNDGDYENLGNLDYFSLSGFYGIPVYYRPSLQDDEGSNPASLPTLGFGFSLPFFPIGPINMSVEGRLITFGFDKEFGTIEESKKIKSITIAALLKTDLQPILNFLGDNIHPILESGITYSLGWDENYSGGLGIVVGGSLDYWFRDSPIGVRLFGNGYMIPDPYESLTGFGNIGASIMLSLKRSN